MKKGVLLAQGALKTHHRVKGVSGWRAVVLGLFTGATLLVLGVGVYRWMKSDLVPASIRLTPEIESVEPGAPTIARTSNHAAAGAKPWETLEVPARFQHLIPGHEQRWLAYASFSYCPLEDSDQVHQVMQSHWERARYIRLNGRPDTSPQPRVRRRMGAVATEALKFLGGSVESFGDIRESYLSKRQVNREAMPQWLFDSYKHFFESSQPFESNDEGSKLKVLEDFFDLRRDRRHSDYLLTHVASSETGFVGGFYWLGSAHDHRERLFELLKREGQADHWTGSITSPGFFLTSGRPSLQDVIGRDGKALWAEGYLIVRSRNNDRFPMRIGAYYDPVTESWNLAEVNYQSSPLFTRSPATIW